MNYLLWGLFGPATWPIWLAALGAALLLLRRPRAARAALGSALVTFLLLGVAPTGLWLMRTLETRFPADPLTTAPTDIVVLAGAEALRESAERGQPEFSSAADRVIAGAVLARRYPEARLWIVGGVRRPGLPRYDADWTRDLWLSLGIPAARIVAVTDTKDTCGNAAGVAARPHGSGVLLVTSAFHMPRSVGCFRAAGIEPRPYPVDVRSWAPRSFRDAFSADLSGNLDRADFALHEWIGLAYYRVQGRIDEIWPAPQALGSRSQTRSE
jgi:uncharacterized SAM-binding protein YcdF (DUF218 family)